MHSSEDCLALRSEAHHLGRRVAAVTKDSSSSSTLFEAEDVERTCRKSFSEFWPSCANGVEGRGVPGAEDSLATNAVGAKGEGLEMGERGLVGSLTTRSS